MKKGIQAKSADTSIIENRLRSTQPGDVVSYDELSKLLGRDVREHCRGNLNTARKTAMHEGIFFDVRTNEGLVRLDGEQATAASEHHIVRSRKAARRGLDHLAHVPFDTLSDESKQKHLTASAQLGAIHLFSTSKSAKKIELAVKSTTSPMAIGETLKLFGG